jgi:predicted phosphoribosyltransferase
VPVAFEVAQALELPLDVLVVRKLGVPGNPELALGAIASGGSCVLNDRIVTPLAIPDYVVRAVVTTQQKELERRERLYRGTIPFPDVAGRTVIVVDDGLATGSTMRAAVLALRKLNPRRIVVAVPTAPTEALAQVREVADDCFCCVSPNPFLAVGLSYEDFSQTSDEQVRELFARSGQRSLVIADSP